MLRSIHESLFCQILICVSTIALILMQVVLGFVWIGYVLGLVFMYWASYFWYKLSEYNELRLDRGYRRKCEERDKVGSELEAELELEAVEDLAEVYFTRSGPYLSSMRRTIWYQYLAGILVLLNSRTHYYLSGEHTIVGVTLLVCGILLLIFGAISHYSYFGERSRVERINELEIRVARGLEDEYNMADPAGSEIEICLCDLGLPIEDCLVCQERLVDELS